MSLCYQLQALPLMLISGAEESDNISKSITKSSSVALLFTRSSLSFGSFPDMMLTHICTLPVP